MQDEEIGTGHAAEVNRRHIPIDALRSVAEDWSDFLRKLSARAEEVGILVLRTGIVGNNTHRPLDPHEVAGFAVADSVAPIILVNTRDYALGGQPEWFEAVEEGTAEAEPTSRTDPAATAVNVAAASPKQPAVTGAATAMATASAAAARPSVGRRAGTGERWPGRGGGRRRG